MVNKSNYTNWPDAKDRLIPEAWPAITPGFNFQKGDKIFTIGSCFARNIEDRLVDLGYNIPMKRFSVPKEEAEYLMRPNGVLNKYTPPSVFQEIEWCQRILEKGGQVIWSDIEDLLYECPDGRFVDLHIGGYIPVTRERVHARRQEIFDVFCEIFSSHVVVITLGMVEAWYDTLQGLFIQRVPFTISADKDRFQFRRLRHQECFDYVQQAISMIRKRNTGCKFLITTSPVPLYRTFTSEDILTANTYSKSVLRAVCGEIVERNEQIDYFPAYENVTLTKDWGVFDKDLLHVSDAFVKKIVKNLVDHYS